MYLLFSLDAGGFSCLYSQPCQYRNPIARSGLIKRRIRRLRCPDFGFARLHDLLGRPLLDMTFDYPESAFLYQKL